MLEDDDDADKPKESSTDADTEPAASEAKSEGKVKKEEEPIGQRISLFIKSHYTSVLVRVSLARVIHS